MKYNQLPQDLQELITFLGYGSYTIESDINDALETAKDIGEFRELSVTKMNELISEAREVIDIMGE